MIDAGLKTRPEVPLPQDAEPTAASEYARARELGSLLVRAPLRHRRLAAAVLLAGSLTSVAAAALAPRVYVVDAKILAQRNLVMPSLGNPRRAVPTDSDAPTRAASEVILSHDNLVAIIKEADLLNRWERERPAVLRLKDRLARVVSGPITEEDRTRALVGVLERRLRVQADETTIRISLEWSHPETAYQIVSLAERNFFERRSAADVGVISDTIGILKAEAERQRVAVDEAFAQVVQLRRETLDAVPAPAAAPPKSDPAPAAAAAAVPPPQNPAITARLDEKRRAIRALDEPRQQKLAQLDAQLARLRLTYTEAHPAVIQIQAEIRAASVEPPELAELRREEKDLVARLAEVASPERARRPLPPRVITAPHGSGAAVIVDASSREDEPELAAAKSRLLVSMRRYEDLMDRVDSARIELNTAQAAFKYRYSVVEPPEIPKEAKRPKAVVLVLGGLALSAVLGVFAAVARDLAGGRFVEAWQVRRRLPIPLLAEVEEP